MNRWWHRVFGVLPADPADPANIVLLDVTAPPDPRPVLRRIVAETLIHQDAAEQVLALVRGHAPLGLVAPQAGPLVRRFFALRDTLPTCSAAADVRIRNSLDVVLHHHAMVLATAQELLAYEWRSETIRRQVETFDGLGAPARLLEELYAELTTGSVPPRPDRATAR